jgi:hypothetical protein
VGTSPAGDGGGGSYCSTGGTTHAAGSEQAGNGGNTGGNQVTGATTTTTNSTVTWTSGGRIDITFTSTLPVTWLDFTATRQNNNSLVLNWSTATELNTRSFLVQRSTGVNDWATVGNIPAARNSTTSTHYQFSDQPLLKNLYYYRLAQIDMDGQMSYSKTVVYVMAGATIKLYPNPVSNGRLTPSLTTASMVSVYNSSGETVFNKKLAEGDNRIDCSRYPAGLYYLDAGAQKMTFIVK